MSLLDDRHEEWSKVVTLVEAINHSDAAAFESAFVEVANAWLLEPAMKACARLQSVSPDIRTSFLKFWLTHGDTMRSQVASDLILIGGLRTLLPPYQGEPVQLFRGETAGNRQRRTYGMSWSAQRSVAESYASVRADRNDGGMVVLGTFAPTEAIISAPGLIVPGINEGEYIVDRRKLGEILVLARVKHSAEFTAPDT
ncbi:hypothetical protein [Devosia submarina]|uniref:hypothetical protein n=1 Tax=Devosia submarina TaxID=1173082 RepID=UPI00130075E1|nr:hypothetical protein [Devosia submarina]